jgi:4-alpha-glucanotransferase
MEITRASGVLAHPTSFPGDHGIGDLGHGTYQFIDWLVRAGQQYWQVMPLTPTGYGDSPYSAPSAFAGNPLLISLTLLKNDGLLDDPPSGQSPEFSDHEVRFGNVHQVKHAALQQTYDRFAHGAASHLRDEFDAFCESETSWLSDFALFMAMKEESQCASWQQWDDPIRARDNYALEAKRSDLAHAVGYHSFVQFLFRRQWRDVKQYANERNIRIIGDIPIYVAYESADVWAHQRLFRLNDDGSPRLVTGVPPDLFSKDGQLWGNPAFDWRIIKETGYQWWIDRVTKLRELVDVIRLDHFRGFAASWVVPAEHDNARGGRWERGPGHELFEAIATKSDGLPFIVEDLGLITQDIPVLREELGLPGMKVLQFAFDGDPENQYLPHNYDRECVVYTGTHDNQTTIGWFMGLSESDRRQVQTYLGTDGTDIAWDMVRLALASVADLSIAPLQDIMRLGDEARMNTPGMALGNWTWRYLPHQLHEGLAAGLGDLTAAYGRRARSPRERGYDPYDYSAPNTEHPLHDQS